MDNSRPPADTGDIAVNALQRCKALGQSIWLDFIRRDLLVSGALQGLIEQDGISGLTSNPAIFEKAIGGSDEYDAALAAFVAAGVTDPAQLFERLALDDIRRAADVLRPAYEAAGGADGFVSLEVSPHLAHDAQATVAEAQRLWQAVGRPNLMIKVPGTPVGIGALRRLTAAGINVNVTLLFARDVYRRVAEAYMDGLEAHAAAGGDAARIASVASFFVSRIDTALDAEIERRSAACADPGERAALQGLAGRIAVASAKLAYADFGALYGSARWQQLAARGARPQRLLWASTGTKNPAYSDVLYVETLIGPQTVNTLPPATMDAFREHGRAQATLAAGVDDAQHVIAEVARLALPLGAVTDRLVDEGVQLFVDAHDKLLAAVAARCEGLRRSATAGRA